MSLSMQINHFVHRVLLRPPLVSIMFVQFRRGTPSLVVLLICTLHPFLSPPPCSMAGNEDLMKLHICSRDWRIPNIDDDHIIIIIFLYNLPPVPSASVCPLPLSIAVQSSIHIGSMIQNSLNFD